MTSFRATQLLGQPMFKLLQKIGNRDVVHMEIGDPDFDTPSNISQAACRAMIAGKTHYTSSYGLPEFIECIRKTTQRTRGFLPDTNQVLVIPGANIGIYYAVYCCCDPGDRVLIPSPGFPTYESAVIAAGCVPVHYALGKDFKIDHREIRDELNWSGAKLVILNSPSNPTGAVTDPIELSKVFSVLEDFDVYGYSDEIYAKMVYDNDFASISVHDQCRERIILSNGFSKAFAMTGWRLGVLISPPELTQKMMLLLQTTQSCVSPFIQYAGIEAIEGPQIYTQIMIQKYKERRDFLVEGLNDLGLRCKKPGGAFYVFPDIMEYSSKSQEFADYLLEKANVAVLPGRDFGTLGEGHIRLSYATSMDNIKKALDQIGRAL